MATIFFIFLTYGIYRALYITGKNPEFEFVESGGCGFVPDVEFPKFDLSVEERLTGILLSLLLWFVMTVLIILLLIA